jgi:hypothetical protein
VTESREARALAIRFATALLCAAVAGCGAKSGLEIELRDAAPFDAPAFDAGLRDAGPRDLGPPDEGPPDLGPADAGCHRDEDCADRVACSVDTCEPALDAGVDGCLHTPDDTRCPISHRCDLVRGCVARVLAIDVSGGLYDVEVPGGAITSLGFTDRVLADIALAADGTFYGATYDQLVRVDSTTGATTPLSTIASGSFNALDFGPDGLLYGASRDQILRLDVATGAVDFIAVLPTGYSSSGDVAFLPDGRMLLTATRTGGEVVPDDLFELRLDGRAPRRIGTMGSPCVWGLAAFGTTIYGLTCRGEVLLVDPATGGSRVLSRASARFGGAAAR